MDHAQRRSIDRPLESLRRLVLGIVDMAAMMHVRECVQTPDDGDALLPRRGPARLAWGGRAVSVAVCFKTRRQRKIACGIDMARFGTIRIMPMFSTGMSDCR